MRGKVCEALDPKWLEQILKQAKWHVSRRFWDVCGCNRDLVITLDKIDFEKTLQPCKPFERSFMFGKGYLSGVVTKLRWQ